MGNPFVYVQLQTQNLQAARQFYKQLFAWDLQETPGASSGYTEILVGEGTAGGMMASPSPEAPSYWLPYVAVDNVHDATHRAEALGGKVILEPTQIPGKGWYSIILDPSGASVALWQTR